MNYEHGLVHTFGHQEDTLKFYGIKTQHPDDLSPQHTLSHDAMVTSALCRTVFLGQPAES